MRCGGSAAGWSGARAEAREAVTPRGYAAPVEEPAGDQADEQAEDQAEEQRFVVEAPFPPAGDQPKAIAELSDGILGGERFQTLLGITGSGKTFTVANLIAKQQRPALILAHNKTL